MFTLSCLPVLHPVGKIVEFLLGAGLAHFVEWHSGMLAPYGRSEKPRAADRAAKGDTNAMTRVVRLIMIS